MAQSSRSSRRKLNRSKLRANIFGPAEVARKKRLSAKLIELAGKQQPKLEKKMKLANGETVATQATPEVEAHIPAGDDAMDIDQAKQTNPTSESVSKSTSRVQKQGRGKARAAMVFPNHKNGRRHGVRFSARDRKKRIRN